MLAAECSATSATGSDGPIAPEHVIQLAVRAAEATESPPGTDKMSNEEVVEAGVDVGVGPTLATDAAVDGDGVPQAMLSKNSDAIAATRFIGFTCCNDRVVFRLSLRRVYCERPWLRADRSCG